MFKSKPVIALTSSTNHIQSEGKEPRMLSLALSYTHSIVKSGGIPVIACEELAETYAEMCDALLMTGGPDVSPGLYGEEPLNDTVKCDPIRDEYETELFNAFLARRKPIMGICRGCQFINVSFGGKLWQDMPEEGFNHRDRSVRHSITAEEGSILYGLFGREFMVNTIHHQCVKTAGDGLRITARSPMGFVEAYQHKSLPIFAVQFHPEKLSNEYNDQTTPDFKPLFDYFIRLSMAERAEPAMLTLNDMDKRNKN